MQPLFCIKHEKMVNPYPSPYASLSHNEWVSSAAGEPFEDLEYCDFDGGWATTPPPPFDLDQYVRENGQPPAVIESDFSPYTFDVETDQILVEALL